MPMKSCWPSENADASGRGSFTTSSLIRSKYRETSPILFLFFLQRAFQARPGRVPAEREEGQLVRGSVLEVKPDAESRSRHQFIEPALNCVMILSVLILGHNPYRTTYVLLTFELHHLEQQLEPVVFVRPLVAEKQGGHAGRHVQGDLAVTFRQHHVPYHAPQWVCPDIGQQEAVAVQVDGCASSVWSSKIRR